MNAPRVTGHGLKHEGAPTSAPSCTLDDCAKAFGVKLTAVYGGVAGPGHALCGCGWQGEHAPSGAQRRREHAQHKLDILGAPGEHPDGGDLMVAVADHTEPR